MLKNPFKKQPPPRGHLRVRATRAGELVGFDEVSPLVPSEVGPALEAALRSLIPVSEAARAERVERLIEEAGRRAGLLDKLRGRAKERLEGARKTVLVEVFEGRSPDGRTSVVLDGGFGFVSLSLSPGMSLEDALTGVQKAVQEASAEVERCWARVLDEEAPASAPSS